MSFSVVTMLFRKCIYLFITFMASSYVHSLWTLILLQLSFWLGLYSLRFLQGLSSNFYVVSYSLLYSRGLKIIVADSWHTLNRQSYLLFNALKWLSSMTVVDSNLILFVRFPFWILQHHKWCFFLLSFNFIFSWITILYKVIQVSNSVYHMQRCSFWCSLVIWIIKSQKNFVFQILTVTRLLQCWQIADFMIALEVFRWFIKIFSAVEDIFFHLY